jgi:hypothetical protein
LADGSTSDEDDASVLVAVTDHAAERFRQRVRGNGGSPMPCAATTTRSDEAVDRLG